MGYEERIRNDLPDYMLDRMVKHGEYRGRWWAVLKTDEEGSYEPSVETLNDMEVECVLSPDGGSVDDCIVEAQQDIDRILDENETDRDVCAVLTDLIKDLEDLGQRRGWDLDNNVRERVVLNTCIRAVMHKRALILGGKTK